MSDDRVKHLEMIQGIINRMASNSFMLKGWAVTLVAGIFALSNKEASKLYFVVAYIPIIVFWGLDSYYLQQERIYRSIYDRVRETTRAQADFSMQATADDLALEKNKWYRCFMSKSELCFYLPLALVCAVVIGISGLVESTK